jgi:hypothetical protein
MARIYTKGRVREKRGEISRKKAQEAQKLGKKRGGGEKIINYE